MAGRTHAEDCVIERRLRPIYEWLDSGVNKKAVQEADKVLRKQPNLHCARVLKGLALLRMGKEEECLALVGQVVKEGPTDETTLQALTICYREMHQPEQICRVYEVAVKGEPGNEELLSHLFMSYVRVGDYKNQQQTAMKLYKLRPKNPYYFWAVMSHVMQAHKSVDPKGKEVSLLLAERMVNNFVKNSKIEAEAEVMTYLHILETQGKYEEALAVLDGPLASKVVHQPENFLSLHRGKYHMCLGQWAAAAAVYRDLIHREPDNWQHYVEYIRSVIHLTTTTTTTTTTAAEDPLVEASQFLSGVRQRAVEENSKDRGPLLGLLQLARALREAGKEDKIPQMCGDPADLLLTYIEVYGDKMCCFGDIVNFLPLIDEERVSGLLERVRNLYRVTSAGVPVDVEAVYRDLCWHQLRRALGQQEGLTAGQHQSFANSLVNLYTNTQNLAANMADTDIRPEDAYLILAAHSYIKAIQLTSPPSTSPPPPANPGEGGAGWG
ncbi:hypothetical protein O3P69_019285 [Scylla paramamosain]|uniref:N-terminal acetyltransferase B complex subunit MDM20 homolog n=1 Tax=Scylla paramamosain TaxID=85552 RepID=A0AAW0SWK4_SCYPA